MQKGKKKGQRADGLFQCKRKMPDGKTKVFYGHSRTEAEAKYRTALQEWEESHPKKGKLNSVTYREAAKAYENYITAPHSPIRRGTISSYRKHLKPTSEFFSDTLMEDIDAQQVKAYLDKLNAAGKAKKTAENARSVISCVFAYWCNYMHGTGNPVWDAKLPKRMPVTERKEPTKEQRLLIEAHPEGCGFSCGFSFCFLHKKHGAGVLWFNFQSKSILL